MYYLKALEILREEEGLSPQPYLDADGGLVVGYGCNLKQEPLYFEEAEYLLQNRVRIRDRALRRQISFFFVLPDTIKAVLISMSYQLGVNGLMAFEQTLKYIHQGEWEAAADEMLDSKWARVDSPARARRMSNLVRSVKEK